MPQLFKQIGRTLGPSLNGVILSFLKASVSKGPIALEFDGGLTKLRGRIGLSALLPALYASSLFVKSYSFSTRVKQGRKSEKSKKIKNSHGTLSLARRSAAA